MNRSSTCKHFKQFGDSCWSTTVKFPSIQRIHASIRHQRFPSGEAVPADDKICHAVVYPLQFLFVKKTSNISTDAEEWEAKPVTFLALVHVVDYFED